MRSAEGLWRHVDFMKLWIGQTVSEFGSRITRDGLPMAAVLTLNATPAQMGLLSALGGAPFLVGSLLAVVCVGLIRKPEPPPAPVETRESVWHELREGMRVVLRDQRLWAIAGSSGTRAFFGSFFGTLYGLFLIREIGLSVAVIGVLISMGG